MYFGTALLQLSQVDCS